MQTKNKYSFIEGIAFDLGDTLIDTESLMYAAASHAVHKLYSEHIINDIQKLLDAFFDTDRKANFPHINHLFSHLDIIQKALETSNVIDSKINLRITTVAGIFLAFYRDKIRELIQPNNDLISLLTNLRKNGFKLGIISNGTLVEQIEVLARLGIVSYFDDIIISEEVGVEKPDPQIFKIASNRLGIEPKNFLFVGDDWEADVIGSLSAGLQVVLSVQYRKNNLNKIQNSELTMISNIENVLQLLDFKKH